MIKIERTGKTDGNLEMHGTVEELLGETVLIMQALAQHMETESGIPAADFIASMAKVATDNSTVDCYIRVVRKRPGTESATMIWEWGDEK